MRDGNNRLKVRLVYQLSVVSLPMRDGNVSIPVEVLPNIPVVSLPMRDGNMAIGQKAKKTQQLLAYL